MDDLISRQAAIDAILAVTGNSSVRELYEHVQEHGLSEMWSGGVNAAIDIIIAVPSAQPETHEERTETHECDYISRQDAIDAHYEYCNKHPDAGFPVWSLKILKNLPSAQPEQTNSWYINSWCIDCKEYDKEKHSCPRFNRVIKQTLDEVYAHAETEAEARFHAQQKWIPCSERLPEHRLYVLVTYKYEYGLIDNGITWYSETENKWNTSREVIAWMPLPETYREEGE